VQTPEQEQWLRGPYSHLTAHCIAVEGARGTKRGVIYLSLLTTHRVLWLHHGRIAAQGPAAQVVQQYTASVPHPAEGIGV